MNVILRQGAGVDLSRPARSRRCVLKEDLQTMRSAIDSYTADKQKAPQSLDDLVQNGYLRAIPKDPMTKSTTTWVTDTSDAMSSLDQTDPGINDVHSGSQDQGSDRRLINSDLEHRSLYQVFMEVRNAAAKILEHTTLADIVDPKFVKAGKRLGKKTNDDPRVLPMVVPGNPRRRED